MQIQNARLTTPFVLPATDGNPDNTVTEGLVSADQRHRPASDEFVLPNGSAPTFTGLASTQASEPAAATPNSPNAVIDLRVGAERATYNKSAALYSGDLSASFINQRAPLTGSHTSSRETAVTGLDFVDQRGFFGGAASVEVELVPQHTVIDRQTMGGQMIEQRRSNVIDESQAVRVRLDRDADGVYRASAGDNEAFFLVKSETGYARFILEDIKVSLHGESGIEDTAYGARYGLL